MTIVKSFSVGNGDMFAIRHDSDNFTIIDCHLIQDIQEKVLGDIAIMKEGKRISRFISTHPDKDHIRGLNILDKKFKIFNFYCVKNEATKEGDNDEFDYYQGLRDSGKVFHIHKGCERRWMNKSDEERDSAGIDILWPDTDNTFFGNALEMAKNGGDPNNISPIILLNAHGYKFLWMGDLETSFMENIANELELPKVDVLFAPHHGRESGHVPQKLLEILDPEVIVIGEAPSENLSYKYSNFATTITQKTAGDITFEVSEYGVNIYVSKESYSTYILDKDSGEKEKTKDSIYQNWIGDCNLDGYLILRIYKTNEKIIL